VVRLLRTRRPELALSVSATTRARRPGEVDGVHYRFLDEAAFQRLVEEGGFLEWAEYAGRRYGTPAAPVLQALAEGRDVVLEIEVDGARQVRERDPRAVLVLLVPPSLEALAARLRGRGTETPEAIARRLEVARAELGEADLFDHVVVNDRLEDAVDELDRILDSKSSMSGS
jgi:guanylate kinase